MLSEDTGPADTGWLVLGAGGQLGRALQAALADRNGVTFWTREQADLSDADALRRALETIRPAAILNAAAYTAVDKAQAPEERPLVRAINAEAPGILAQRAASLGIPLVHVSTDYVFNGSGKRPFREDDPTGPLNVYGETKLAGERAVAESGCDYLTLRTSWVYDAHGHNFVNTMLRLGAQRDTLRVVADQTGAPGYAPHLAGALVEVLDQALARPVFPSGLYHLCHAGETSWHGFAEAIFAEARMRGMELAVKDVVPIPTNEYPTPAQRPLNSRLDCTKLHETFGLALPHWREGLRACLDVKTAS